MDMFIVNPQTAGAPRQRTRKTKSIKSKSPKALKAKTDVKARTKIALLTAENKALRLQRDEMASRFAALKLRLTQQFKEMQEGVQQRISNGDTKTGIMEYMKAGFGTALGVIAAIAVVDLVVDAVDDIRDDSHDDNGDDNGYGNDDGDDGDDMWFG